MQQVEATMDKTLLSEPKAAKRLGISRPTLLRLRQSGAIGFYRIASRVLYDEQIHLMPFLEKNERKPKEKKSVRK